MQGVCIYRDYDYNPVILAYKELKNNLVRVCKFKNSILYANDINLKEITKIISRNCLHILTSLPEYSTLDESIKYWPIIIKNQLENLNII